MIPKNILHQYKTNIQKHSIDGYQVKSKKIKREIRLIGIVINWMTVDDFINKVKIRDKHLDFCINKEYKPDSIKKEVFKNPERVSWFLNDEKICVSFVPYFQWDDTAAADKFRELLMLTALQKNFWGRQVEDYQIPCWKQTNQYLFWLLSCQESNMYHSVKHVSFWSFYKHADGWV